DKAKSELPTDLDQDPDVLEINTSDFPIMNVSISGDYPEEELKEYAEYLEDEIEKLPEISKADLGGTIEREIRIDANLYQMEAMGEIGRASCRERVEVSGVEG